MAIARVQSAFAQGSSSNPAVTLPGASTSGNLLVFVYCWAGSLAIADDPTYNAASSGAAPGIQVTSTISLYQYYFYNITGTGTPTVTHGGVAPSAWAACLIEYSGARTTATVYDVGSSDTFTTESSPQNSGNTSVTVQSKEVAIGAVAVQSNSLSITNDATYTSVGNQAHSVAALKLQVADKILSSKAAQSFGITYTGTATGTIQVATYKAQDATDGLIHLPLGMCG